ncbi:MAG: Hsp20/alpha crystallin family protein, partial [Thaumarchaeota archaeon]|nr:Hsp20/alpha crystallin family protein [Nitrososphaerota archaeon]
RSFLRYRRILTVPERIAESDITAKMNNGTLTVELPKKSSIKKETKVQSK